MPPITFAAWLREVDAAVYALIGVGRDHLIDFDYATAYEDGETPEMVANLAVLADVGVMN